MQAGGLNAEIGSVLFPFLSGVSLPLAYLVHHTCYAEQQRRHRPHSTRQRDGSVLLWIFFLSYISCVSECDCPPPSPPLPPSLLSGQRRRRSHFSTRFTIACKKSKASRTPSRRVTTFYLVLCWSFLGDRTLGMTRLKNSPFGLQMHFPSHKSYDRVKSIRRRFGVSLHMEALGIIRRERKCCSFLS